MPTSRIAPDRAQHRRDADQPSRSNLDGSGRAELATGVPFLDHMLDQVARHGVIDLDVARQGRPAHRRAPHGRGHRHHARAGGGAGGRRQEGPTRYGHAYVPLDEALSRVVIDLSGRPGLEFHVPFTRAMIGAFDVDLRTSSSRASSTTRWSRCTSTTCAATTPTTRPRRCSRRSPARCGWRSPPTRARRASCRRQGASCSSRRGRTPAAAYSSRHDRHRRRRLRNGQPALGGEGARATSRRSAASS